MAVNQAKVDEILAVFRALRNEVSSETAAVLTQTYFDEIERDFVHEQNETSRESQSSIRGRQE